MIGDLFADFGPLVIETTLSENVTRIAAEAASEGFSTLESPGRTSWRMITPFTWKGSIKGAAVIATWDEGSLTLEFALPAFADPDEDDYANYMKALGAAATRLGEGVEQRVRALEKELSTP